MRARVRQTFASCLPIESRRPIILPKDHTVTRLLLVSYHKRYYINMATVMAEVRRKFWIPSLRQVIKSIKSACLEYRLRLISPRPPKMGDLPFSPFMRLFSYCGIDYFGPIMVTIRRQKEKRWVALFTCLSTRAIHLEVASDLSSDACLVCLRNFINRRGVPVQIRTG